jgi:antirestriction protein ArdC
VRQGEKGTHIEFWEVKEKSADQKGGAGEATDKEQEEAERRLIHRVYTVFNAKQIEGIPAYQPKEHSTFEAAEAGERILTASGARMSHDQQDKAFYRRATDSIHLPAREAFADPPGYYGTALHELAHWTGHPSRLNRSTLTESYRFGDTNYAKEELRAELASVFLAAELGVPHDPKNHAAYVGSWIKALREDKNEIFRAAQDASVAADFVLSLDRERASGREGAPEHKIAENTRYVAREEPGSGTIALHEKASGDDRHTGTEKANFGESFTAAKALTHNSLGEAARTYTAQTQSGTYNGQILGETDHHVVQRLSGRSAVAHMKHLLQAIPKPGDNVCIAYVGDRAQVREAPGRARGRELGR